MKQQHVHDSDAMEARFARALSSGGRIFDGMTPGELFSPHTGGIADVIAHTWISTQEILVVCEPLAHDCAGAADHVRVTFSKRASHLSVKLTVASATFLGAITWLDPHDYDRHTLSEFTQAAINAGNVVGIITTDCVLVHNFDGITPVLLPGDVWSQPVTDDLDYYEQLACYTPAQLHGIRQGVADGAIDGETLVLENRSAPCAHLEGAIFAADLADSYITIVHITYEYTTVTFADTTPAHTAHSEQ